MEIYICDVCEMPIKGSRRKEESSENSRFNSLGSIFGYCPPQPIDEGDEWKTKAKETNKIPEKENLHEKFYLEYEGIHVCEKCGREIKESCKELIKNYIIKRRIDTHKFKKLKFK